MDQGKKESGMKNVVVYHGGCNDGFTAAWLFWLVYGDKAEYIPATHGTPIPAEDFTGANVVFVDFSFKRPEMEEIAKVAASLVVLDHHESAVKELEGMDGVILDMDRSGAMMALDWLGSNGFPETDREPNTPAKLRKSRKLVEFIQDRDLYQNFLINTLEVAAYMRSVPHEFNEWSAVAALLHHAPYALIGRGEGILNYWNLEIERHLREKIELKIGGHIVPAVNATTLYSEIAGELAKGAPFGAVYFDTADNRTWSLRSDQNGVNVAEIAALYGGGGHRHAAGFRSDKTFELEPVGDVGA